MFILVVALALFGCIVGEPPVVMVTITLLTIPATILFATWVIDDEMMI